MFKIKRITFIFLCCIFAFTAWGCKQKGATDEPSPPKKVEVEKIVEYVDVPSSEITKYVDDYSCLFLSNKKSLQYNCTFSKVPRSDDNYVYLFSYEIYEDDFVLNNDNYVAKVEKDMIVSFKIPYDETLLFKEFIPAMKFDGEYVPLAIGSFPTNPNVLADNQKPHHVAASKKGILLDPVTVENELFTSLNVKHAVYNVPLSFFVGYESDPSIPQIEIEYDGKTYYVRESSVQAYDQLFTYLNSLDIEITAIVLNDYNKVHPELIHPLSREKTKKSKYYQFNSEEEDGVKMIQALALFFAERYSNEEYGLVSNWVIANEINQHRIWNYMNSTDVEYYTESFEKVFRIFYNAIKSKNASARVYFSIDNEWNSNNGDNSKWFNCKELLSIFNEKANLHGNYDWSLAIHPYPVPISRVNYWSQPYDMTENASNLTIMNLSTLTDVLQRDEYINPYGEVRSIAVTELGYSSRTGEKLQAAAFAYCYKIVEQNDFIDMFLLNRETDSRAEMKDGLYLGLYNLDYTEKYVKEVFSNIDGENCDEYNEMICNIINAESIEDALTWAQP